MAYTKADFETHLDAAQAAIDAEDKKAFWKAIAKAEAVLSRLSLEKSMGDEAGNITRRENLENVRKAGEKFFESVAEVDGGGSELYLGRPESL